MPRGRRGGHRPFYSKAQWRLFFASPKLRRYAHDKAHATKGGPKVRYRRLPVRKGAPGASSLRGLGLPRRRAGRAQSRYRRRRRR